MTTTMRLAAGIALVAVLGFGALQLLGPVSNVGSKATPSPTTAPAAPTELPTSALVPFTSAVYAYSISVPKGWGVQVATRTLHETEPLWGSDPQVATPAGDSIQGGDFARNNSPSGRLLIAASPMPPGTTVESWTAETSQVKCGAATSQSAITIDGEAGTLSTYPACSGLFVQWATVLHDGWAWHVAWLNNQGSEVADVALFEQLLATFRFGEVPLPSPAPS